MDNISKNIMQVLFPELEIYVRKFDFSLINKERKLLLHQLMNYINKQIESNNDLALNFICTHNSRRSQLCQIWAFAAAKYFGVPGSFYSAGTEITEFNINAVNVLKKAGFKINKLKSNKNPVYNASSGENTPQLSMYSKLVEDKINPTKNFGAIMTCSNANENCPFISGADVRIGLTYEDPKIFDLTIEKDKKYEERSIQIGTEMFYLFSKVG